MFWNRYREAAIVGLSLLAGIVLTVLAFLNLLTPGALIPALGAGFGALCLWIAAFVSASPLRQNPEYGRCVCLRTAIGALALMGVSALTLALLPPAAWLLLILLFLIFTLGVYAALSLASLLGCLAWGGRTARG